MTADHHTPAPRMPAWVLVLGAAALVVLVAWGVSTWATRTPDAGFATGEPITVEGCLTAGPASESFVLTTTDVSPLGEALARSATDVRPTFTYQLVGNASELKPRVGQRVEITGIVEDDILSEAELDRESGSTPAADPAVTSGDDATVQTTHEAEIEQRRMQVRAVQPTGEPCLVGNGSASPVPDAD